MTLRQVDAQFEERLRTAFAAQLPTFLPQQRWFGSKAKRIHSVQLSECIPVPLSDTLALIALARVEYAEGPGETYVLPIAAPPPNAIPPARSVVVRLPVSEPASEMPLMDAFGNPEFLTAILDSILKSAALAGDAGVLRLTPEKALLEKNFGPAGGLPPRVLKAEQSNTSIAYGDALILKLFRRVEEGIHPDLEVGHFLTAVAHFTNVPPLYASLQYESDSKIATLGMLQGFVPNRGDAWSFTVESLVQHFSSADHRPQEPPFDLQAHPGKSQKPVHTVSNGLATQLQWMGLLGKRTAELHLALASSNMDPAFAPEPFTPEVREALNGAFHDLAVQNFQTLRSKLPDLPEPTVELARLVLKLEDDALLALHAVMEREITALRTRIHGDYHLGQVLFTGSDFFIIDFEGEPARPLSERRTKRSPLQDVAGMLRSFHYAARAAALATEERLARSHQPSGHVAALAAQWQARASHEFLRAYRSTAGKARFLPSHAAEFDALLRVHLLEKAVYELGYELNTRPGWIAIPLEGIREILTSKS